MKNGNEGEDSAPPAYARFFLLNSILLASSTLFTLAVIELSSYFIRLPVQNITIPDTTLSPISNYLPAGPLAALQKDLQKARCYTEKEASDLYKSASRFGINTRKKFAPPGARPFKFRSILRVRDTNAIIYDVDFHLDKFNWRNPPEESRKTIPALAMLGDSYVFGEGLGEAENIPQRLRDLNPGRAVFNFGISGGAPNDFLRMLQTEEKSRFTNYPLQGSTVIFLFSNVIPERVNCSLSSYIYLNKAYIHSKPRYLLSSDGHLEYKGQCDQASIRSWLFKMLAHSNFIKVNNIVWPPPLLPHPKNLAAQILVEIQRILKKEFGVKRFVVVVYPEYRMRGMNYSRYFKEAGLEVYDLANLDIKGATRNHYLIPVDHHPSPSAALVMAHLIHFRLFR